MAGDSSQWRSLGRLDDIPRLGARVVRFGSLAIAVFRTSSDQVFALRDQCPHRGGPLSQGIVHGSCVTCPLHDWVIDLATGEARGPDEGRTPGYPVRLDGDVVLVRIPEAEPARTGEDAAGPAAEPLALAR